MRHLLKHFRLNSIAEGNWKFLDSLQSIAEIVQSYRRFFKA
eukprot:SAG11_NODE_26055_length_350_cov_1.035857_1_plen_40_part_10